MDSVNPISIKLFNDLESNLLKKSEPFKTIRYVRYSSMFFEPLQAFIEECFMFSNVGHYFRCGEKVISIYSNPLSLF